MSTFPAENLSSGRGSLLSSARLLQELYARGTKSISAAEQLQMQANSQDTRLLN